RFHQLAAVGRSVLVFRQRQAFTDHHQFAGRDIDTDDLVTGHGDLICSPSSSVPRPCTTVDRPCTQAPGGLWDTPRLRRFGAGAALRTGSSSPMSLGRSGLPDRPNDRSSEPSATYKDAPR